MWNGFRLISILCVHPPPPPQLRLLSKMSAPFPFRFVETLDSGCTVLFFWTTITLWQRGYISFRQNGYPLILLFCWSLDSYTYKVDLRTLWVSYCKFWICWMGVNTKFHIVNSSSKLWQHPVYKALAPI